MRRLLMGLLAGIALGSPAWLSAQCADTLVRRVTAHVDSTQEETVRRSPTTGRYLAPRATVVRHHLAQILTLVNACGVSAIHPPSLMTTTTTLWERAVGAYPRGDSAVICAVVQLGDSAHRIGATYVISHAKPFPDSITWRVVVPPAVGELRETCRPNWDNVKYGHIASRQPFPIQWVPRKVQPFTIAFPFAQPVVP